MSLGGLSSNQKSSSALQTQVPNTLYPELIELLPPAPPWRDSLPRAQSGIWRPWPYRRTPPGHELDEQFHVNTDFFDELVPEPLPLDRSIGVDHGWETLKARLNRFLSYFGTEMSQLIFTLAVTKPLYCSEYLWFLHSFVVVFLLEDERSCPYFSVFWSVLFVLIEYQI